MFVKFELGKLAWISFFAFLSLTFVSVVLCVLIYFLFSSFCCRWELFLMYSSPFLQDQAKKIYDFSKLVDSGDLSKLRAIQETVQQMKAPPQLVILYKLLNWKLIIYDVWFFLMTILVSFGNILPLESW